MKKIILSAAVAAMAFSTSAMAADKGIDINVGGQAVVYYETHDDNGAVDTSMFDQADSVANVGIQLNLGADLGNNFTFGSQLTYLGTAGLEKNLVGNTKQTALYNLDGDTRSDVALTKIFLAKQIANTTVKLGRQELPKSLSPLAFSEGWNVYKNTFDAIVAINTDIPNTTLVGAYVAGGTGMSLESTSDIVAATTIGNLDVDDTAYMITASTTAIPMATVTASYYHLSQVADDLLNTLGENGISANAMWLDVQIADKDLPMGLNVGLQYGNINPDSLSATAAVLVGGDFDDTTAYGAKIALSPMDALSVSLAYSDVDGDDGAKNYVAIKNTGTGIKTPLFTQMVYNQDAISLSAKTIVGSVSYSMGDMGSITAAYGSTKAGNNNAFGADADYKELDVIYKLNAGGVQYFAAYVDRDVDNNGAMNAAQATASKDQRVRIWARYNF